MIKKCIILFLFCFSLQGIQAQNDFFKNPVWSISVFNHSIGLRTKKPINLGVTLGAEFTYNQKEIGSWHQKVEIGLFRHKNLNKALYLKTDVVRRHTYKNGLFHEGQFGIGYIFDTPANQPFVQNDDGAFQASNLSGRSNFITGIGIGGGYQFTTKEQITIAPFFRYEAMLQFPYSDIAPIFPQSLLHIGSRIKL